MNVLVGSASAVVLLTHHRGNGLFAFLAGMGHFHIPG